MADTIDSLQIEINAQASKANDAIDRLVGKLDRLTTSLGKINGTNLNGLANGVQRLGNAMQVMNNVSTADFTRLASNLTKLGSVNVSALNSAASSMSNLTRAFNSLGTVSSNAQAVGDMAKNIAKLGNKSVQTAITNIPQLATAMNNLMTTLSRSPQVSQNVIQMTNALANLASQGSRVGTASRSLVSGLNNSSNAAVRAKKNFSGLAGAIGKFYATYFMVIRGLKGLWSSIESTADYIEAYNYFNVALGKIGSDWAYQFDKYGYDNAESYADSFSTRLSERLGKLSGVQISVGADGKGLLTESGMKNLGLNIQEITQYASQLASVTNSVGQTGETSIAIASSFTKLAGDISSLFNMDYSTVAKNLQSGIIGQSRALYKFGLDITAATLQTYAYNLGIEKSVSEMTQAEKMQLRVLAILDQSKVSWGDLANTINSPSNMIRQFTNNLKETGIVLGQLFIPILQKVMPVINGVTIAIKRLLVSIAGLFGIKIDFDAFGKGYSDMEDGIGGVSDSLDDVTKSAKKANAGLRAFDELKVINMPDTTGSVTSGIGGIDLTDKILQATEEYEKKWQEAFDKMESTAQKWADKIEKIFEPIKRIFKDFFNGNFWEAGYNVSNLVISITDFFAKAIDNVDWYGIGKKIGDFLSGVDWFSIFESVGNLMWQALKAAFEMYVGAFSTAPLETAAISLAAIPNLLKAIAAAKYITGTKKLWNNFKIWGEKIALATGALLGNNAAVSGLYILYPKLGSKIDAVKNAFAKFVKSVSQKGIWKTIDSGITSIRKNLGVLQKGAITAVAGFAEFNIVSDVFEGLTLGTENLVSGIAKIGGAVAVAAAAMYTALGPAGLAIAAITGVVAGLKGINDAFETIKAKQFGEAIKNALTNPGGTPLEEVVTSVSDSIRSIGDGFLTINQKTQELEISRQNIQNVWQEIELVRTKMDEGVISVGEGTAKLNELFTQLSTTASERFHELELTLLSAFGENGVLRATFEELGVDTEKVTGAIVTSTSNVETRVNELTSLLASTDPSNPKYSEYLNELYNLTGGFGEVEKAVSDFALAIDSTNIDYGKIVAEDGSLDTTYVTGVLDTLTLAVKDADEGVTQGIEGIRASLQEQLNKATAVGDSESAAALETALSYIPDALSNLEGNIQTQATNLTNAIQNDVVGGINGVIEDASAEWENMNFLEKAFAGSKDNYIKEAVDNYQTNVINPLSKQIETAMGQLGIDGAEWAASASEEIIGGIFVPAQHFAGKVTYTTLKDNYASIIKQALNDTITTLERDGTASDVGKYTVEGAGIGAIDNANLYTDKITEVSQLGQEAFNKDNGINSPSTVYAEKGKYIDEGLAKGINDNAKTVISKITMLSQNSRKEFSSMISPMYQIGADIMNGLYMGLSSMEYSLYGKAQEIADNIANTIKTALDIHSPSKVMFKLGDFAIQGLKDGMENLYTPTLDSIKAFSYEIADVPQMSLGYAYPQQQYNAYQPAYPMGDTYYQADNSETNALLRELINAVRQGGSLELNGTTIGNIVRKEDKSYYKRTGKGMFEH